MIIRSAALLTIISSLIAIIVGLIFWYFDIDSAAGGLVPIMAASILTGAHFFKQQARLPTSSELFIVALLSLVFLMMANVFVVVVMNLFIPGTITYMKLILSDAFQSNMGLFCGILLFILGITYAVIFFFIRFGAKTAQKNAQ